MTEQMVMVGIGSKKIEYYGSLVHRGEGEIKICLTQEPRENAFPESNVLVMVLEVGNIEMITAQITGREGRNLSLQFHEEVKTVRRRAFRRYAVELKVKYGAVGARPDALHETKTIDISFSGMCLHENPAAPLPDEFEVTFSLPLKAVIGKEALHLAREHTLKAKVYCTRRSIINDRASVGVIFTEIAPEDSNALHQFLEGRIAA